MTVPKRIQLRRTKGWEKPANAIVVARPSRWGNPWKVGDSLDVWSPDGRHVASIPVTPDLAVACYREYVAWLLKPYDDDALDDDKAWVAGNVAALEQLRGKDLACWCPLDQPCHADVLLELANR